MRIEDIDKNFLPEGIPEGVEMEYFNVREEPFKVWGLLYEDDSFCRLPDAVAKATNPGVYSLHEHSAGGRVTFRTNSRYVAISAKLRSVAAFSHFPACGFAGFDLYVNDAHEGTFRPPYNVRDGYGTVVSFSAAKEREIVINFPLYSAVTSLHIGLEKGATLSAYNPYLDIAPIVYYGSSITQGGCASRPGNAYQAKISRELAVDHINLGFSGSAKGEEVMANYIADLKMSAFVMDYDHNAPTVEHLEKTHERFYKIIREKNPNLPIIFVSSPDFWKPSKAGLRNKELRRATILDTYTRNCREDENLYFIDGAAFYQSVDIDYCTVDNCHPNDLGFYCMAMGMLPTLRKILK